MKKILLFYVLIQSCLLSAQSPWPEITSYAKPWTRWWWMGSAVNKEGISHQLQQYHQSGLGGVEIVPIYGAKGFEKNYISYLSPKWMEMLHHTVQQSDSLGMGVYLSVGTGWPIGGPQVSTKDAATKIIFQNYHLDAAKGFNEKIVVTDPKQKNVAYLSALSAYDTTGAHLDLTRFVNPDGTLSWRSSNGSWQLIAAFAGKTGQAVKRAAPGGEGYTLDHFSTTSLDNYFKLWDSTFGNTANGAKAFYNDSYEVYGADWTPQFFQEFQKRRGYDLKKYLKELASNDTTDLVARVKTDYRETMADLMLQNFSRSFTKWSHQRGAQSLNQAHGSPGNLLDLYAAVDIPETETFGSSYFSIPGLRRDSADVRNVDPDPVMMKFASSAAHAMGNKLVSCETFTWLTEHFKTSWAQCKPEVEQTFLAGINHVFYHGTTYSPPEVAWPGWLFYASVNFVPANSLWPHVYGLNHYITRCQTVLQSGQPDNEVLAYWPVYDVWHKGEGMDMPLKIHDIDEWLHPTPFYKNYISLQQKGYSIDFASDRMLANASVTNGSIKLSPKGAAHKVLLISRCKLMPVETMQHIIRLAEDGATIVMQDLPEDVPGLHKLAERRKQLSVLVKKLKAASTTGEPTEIKIGKGKIILAVDAVQGMNRANIAGETLVETGLKFLRRSFDGGKYYYIVNHTPDQVDRFISLQYNAHEIVMLDPQTGNYGVAPIEKGASETRIRLQLQPGESIILKAFEKSSGQQKKWNYWQATTDVLELNGEWNLRFKEGGPMLPADRTMKGVQPWTALQNDSTTQHFSGTGVYTTKFVLPKKDQNNEYLLSLGTVAESAKIIVNGKEAGLVWSIPFQLKIGAYLQEGENTIAIEVANLMANRIRYMDRQKMEWRKYHEINFVNINYKNFDASNWKVQPSGLIGPVRITLLAAAKRSSH